MPRIGLLSDSHGRDAVTRRAVALLIEHGAQMLVHLGDVGSAEVIDALLAPASNDAGLLPAHLVFGNTDRYARELARYATRVGVQVDHPVGCLACDEKKLIFLHGDDRCAMEVALGLGPAYLCHGHTHACRDERIGPTRVINPGALHRAAAYTVALLDTAADRLDFHRVEAMQARI